MIDHLTSSDPDVAAAVRAEVARQRDGLELIASENFTSVAVLEAMGTPLTNKYSEGYPGKRYYGGNEFIDTVENLARDRVKQIFGAEHANVQPHSGANANLAAFFALLELKDTILAMNLAHGGHLTHGSPVNFSGKFYTIVPYGVRQDTGRIDMDEVRQLAREHKPKLILAGASAYPRTIDFAAFRAIADEVGAYLMVDMAHIAGLVAAKLHPDPVAVSDVVTSTTHKTLRGPRGGFILSKTIDRLRPDDKKTLAQRIDSAIFPGTQGGPLDHVIAGKAVAFKEALEPSFVDYQRRILENAQRLSSVLAQGGLSVVSGGTDNHLVLVDVTSVGISGKEAEAALERAGIYVNKNMIPFDQRKPLDPSGIRLGSPALTTRGFTADDFTRVAQLIANVLRAPADEAVAEQTRTTVHELTATHPLYPDLTY